MKKLIEGIFLSCIVFLAIFLFTPSKEDIQKLCERTYFEGQKDAIQGDTRIKLNKDSVYIWIKSPWDSNKKPIYYPDYLDSKK